MKKTDRAASAEFVSISVEYALSIGFKHIDCAATAECEVAIGEGIAANINGGALRRSEVFVSAKLSRSDRRPKDIVLALRQTLRNLRLSRVDLFVVHWPCSNSSTEIVPLLDSWRAMEQCVRSGLASHIGLSNFSLTQCELILAKAQIRPTLLQCEAHPFLAQSKLIRFCRRKDIQFQAHSPFGDPNRPRTWNHLSERLMSCTEIRDMASELEVSVEALLLRFHIDRGCAVVCRPKEMTPMRIKAAFDVWDFALREEHIQRLIALDRNIRYHVSTELDEKGKRVVADAQHPQWPWKGERVADEQ